LVEQRIENPRVGGSIPPQATTLETRMNPRFTQVAKEKAAPQKAAFLLFEAASDAVSDVRVGN
jgi:hypothetical protein